MTSSKAPLHYHVLTVRLFNEIPYISITHVASAKKGITAITNGYAVFKRSLTLASFESSFNGQMSSRSEHDKGHDTDDGGFEELHDLLKMRG
jgi:hypothetical protein